MNAGGYVVYRGPSRLDGAPVAAVVTGLRSSSTNAKTGAMAQTWILRSDVHPVEARHIDADTSICGDCPLALSARHADTDGPKCYVNVGFGPTSVYRGLLRGIYPDARPSDVAAIAAARGLAVRIGSYGDPAAVPTTVWRNLAGDRRTGYTHQWRRRSSLRNLVMASVDSVEQYDRAHELGYRTFRVIPSVDAILPGEILCPASAEAGRKTHCADCLLCNGAKENDRRKSIAIVDHGPTAARKASL